MCPCGAMDTRLRGYDDERGRGPMRGYDDERGRGPMRGYDDERGRARYGRWGGYVF